MHTYTLSYSVYFTSIRVYLYSTVNLFIYGLHMYKKLYSCSPDYVTTLINFLHLSRILYTCCDVIVVVKSEKA